MKVITSSFFRSIVAAIVGFLLIQFRETAVEKITIAIGILFLLSGIISIIAYFSALRRYKEPTVVIEGQKPLGRPTFPIAGIGSAILGVILMLMPSTFITGLMYCFAAILIVGALGQFFTLIVASRFARIGAFYWIMPILLFVIGLICIIHPQTIESAPLFFLGWCLLVYAVVEAINAIKIHACKKAYYKAHKQVAEPQAEEIKDVTPTESEDQKKIENI